MTNVRPFGTAQRALEASNLESTKEWQALRAFIEKSVEDLKEILATRVDKLEQVAAIQGQISAFRAVLSKVEEWDARKEN